MLGGPHLSERSGGLCGNVRQLLLLYLFIATLCLTGPCARLLCVPDGTLCVAGICARRFCVPDGLCVPDETLRTACVPDGTSYIATPCLAGLCARRLCVLDGTMCAWRDSAHRDSVCLTGLRAPRLCAWRESEHSDSVCLTGPRAPRLCAPKTLMGGSSTFTCLGNF